MKSYLLALGMLILVCPARSQSQNSLSNSTPNSIDKNWLQQAEKVIAEQEYEFKRSEHRSFDFYVANRKQKIGFALTSSGYSVSPIDFTGTAVLKNWKADFEFVKLTKGENELLPDDKYTVSHNRSDLRFQFSSFGIEYINNENGLRQNFIVYEKPKGNDALELLLQVSTELKPVVNNNELILSDKNGINQLFYKDLNVWDADHQPLKATMELRDEGTLAIIVDDKHARYPITIDPLNQTPDWTTSADGILPGLIGQLAVDAAYGFSVAGLGDINGDGFDDVAVGAPTMVDLISGTGNLAAVGAVFVYRGSSTGLPTTPSAVLQPTTAIAGVLFGYSIAGGDINGDGKNDILVGAPMDNISVTANGNTVTGRVGKAYVFNGANLATGSSPFLQIQLSGGSIISNINISVKALFGFSVAVTEDLNGDGKKDIIIGAPTYAGIKTVLLSSILDVQSGGAFVYLTKAANNTLTQVKLEPIKQDLLGLGLITENVDGLLFGYAVDGTGDYDGDGKADVVATAPGGILLNGKILQGSAEVYYGTGSGVNTDYGAVLTAPSGGFLNALLGNTANLFGVSVKGVRGPSCARNGNIIVGAPLGGAIINILGVDLKTGTVSVFKKKASRPSGYVSPDQVLASPRNSNNILQIIQANLLFGYSLDNICDINCDGYADIIVGEPISSGVHLLDVNATGGAAYVYYGNASGTYQTSPAWTLTVTVDAFLGVNATSLIGYSVAGAGRVKGSPYNYCILVGSPSRTLDFGNGLLNLGSTLGTLFSLVAGNNGVGKAYLFDIKTCDHQPVAVNDVISTNEDTPVNGNAATNDVPSLDGENTWSLVANPSHGTASMNSDGTYTYTPSPNYNGSDVFTYKLCDVDGDCSTATVTVTINPVDDFPIAVNDVASTSEDSPVSGGVASNDTQSGDGGNIWALVANPSHGTVSMNTDGTYIYNPAADYNGFDVFTYKLCDADGDCSTATVTITITPVNDVPVAVNDAITTNEDTPITNASVAGNDTQSGDGGNTWSLVANPSHGSVSLSTNGTYNYTPAANYNGSDSFKYKLCDADGDCSTATVNITITPVNDVPVAVNDAITTNEDTPITNASVAGNDTQSGDGGNTWSLVTNPSHGTVSLSTNGTYNYMPAANYNGSDSFKYKLCDADGDCSTATVNITITPVNDVPVAVNDAITTNEDTPITNASVAGNDTPSGDCANTWTLLTNPLHGSVSLSSNGTYTYTPAANYNGSDAFTYKLCDCEGDCSTATVSIMVSPVNDVPTAVNDNVTTNEDTPASGNVGSNDNPSSDCTNTWTLLTNPSHGTVSLSSNGTYTYTPAANYNGSDAFTYKLCDCEGDCSTATVSITVAPVNDVPTAVNDNVTTNEDTPASGNVGSNDNQSGDCTNTWTLLTNPSHGSVLLSSNGVYTYTPAANYNGSDGFTYKLCDCENDCSTATVSITVSPIDDLPDAVNDVATTNANTPITNASVAANDFPSGDCSNNTWSLVTNPSHGTVSLSSNGTYTYTPAANYSGSDQFTYKLCDCDAVPDCDQATVTITINSPCANDQTPPTIQCPGTQTLSLGPSCNASLPDYRGLATASDNCNVTVSQSPAPGTLVSGVGPLTVTLTATDGTNTRTCTFTVNKVDQTPPTLTCQQAKTIDCNATLTFDAPSTSDNCGQPSVSVISNTSTTNGSATVYTQTWRATDGSGNTATCSQSVTRTACIGPLGHIYPTSTTCNTYLNGAQPLAQLCYAYKQGKVSNVTPGVFFYFATFTATSSSFTIDIIQTKSCANFSFFAIQQGTQITLFNSSCGNFLGGRQTTTGQGQIIVTNATLGAKYIISVKYDSKSVQGSAFTGSAPVCQYNFETRIDGNVVSGSQGSISLTPNCSGGAIANQTAVQEQEAVSAEAQIGLFPNPASEYVTVRFVGAHTAKSSIEMYDVSGRLVQSIYNGEIQQGRPYQKRVDIKGLSSGVYVIRFRNGEFIETKKLVIAK